MSEQKIILFGAGQIGKKALSYFGPDRIHCFADNNEKLAGSTIENIPVISFETLKEIYPNYQIVISMDIPKSTAVVAQMEEAGICQYTHFMQILSSDPDYLAAISKTEHKVTVEAAETMNKMVKKGSGGGAEFPSTVYDECYRTGGGNGNYHKHYKQSQYYFSWLMAMTYLEKFETSASILEIGCGVGQFAGMLFDYGFTNYVGFDYSTEAVKRAKQSNGMLADRFFVADAFETELLEKPYDLVICFEVLEHLNKDRELLGRICSGQRLLLSVPNFDSDYHVRYFCNEAEIQARYGQIIKIDDIKLSMLSDDCWLYYIWGEKL